MPPISGARRRRALRRRAGAVAAGLAVTAVVTGVTASPVASLSPSPECPLAYPVSHLYKGQPVTGLTVTHGTEPEEFQGEIIGVLHDGIAPGLDMIMAQLSSTEIDRAGIWQGMSGSPVYADDGTLIGAVAYGLASGPSPVAGITPAEEMYRLLRDAPKDDPAQTVAPSAASGTAAAGAAAGDEPVSIPPTITKRLARTGVASVADTSGGLTRLPLPLTISGMWNTRRLHQATKALNLSGVRVHSGGGVTDSREHIPVVAGGNLAASISYGDLSAVGVGTATAVCGDQVLAFGHPMNFTGASGMTMHGADALYIQEDPAGTGFKVANTTAPIGAIAKDRMAGLMGIQREDAVPATTRISSYVEVPGDWWRRGTTRISVPEYVPDISAFHLLADEDRVFDGLGGGSATVTWRIVGTREDGRLFRLVRTNKYAMKSDLSYLTALPLYNTLAQLQYNGAEDVTIDRIHTRSVMSHRFKSYDIAKVLVLEKGHWREVRKGRPVFLRPGATKRFEVLLESDTLRARRLLVQVPVPRNIGFRPGLLRILGGNSSGGGESYVDESEYMGMEDSAPASFDTVLRGLRQTPHNDQVLAKLMLFRPDGSAQKRTVRATAPEVVNGGVTVRVQGTGFPQTPPHPGR